MPPFLVGCGLFVKWFDLNMIWFNKRSIIGAVVYTIFNSL